MNRNMGRLKPPCLPEAYYDVIVKGGEAVHLPLTVTEKYADNSKNVKTFISLHI